MAIADTVFRLSIQGHVKFLRATGGRIGGKRLLLLTTTGAKTGKQRVTPLRRIDDGDNYLIAGSMGGAPSHPGWFYNLKANPLVQVQVGTKLENRLARVTKGAERDRLFQKFVDADKRFGTYASKTDRVIPVVVLERINNQSR